MLAVRVIPCLDVRDGRVVKGVQFQGLRDSGDAVELGTEYERQGADELVVLDVAATPAGRAHGREVIRSLRAAIGLPMTVGGGVRTVEDARALLDSGADKVAVNTAAVDNPDLIRALRDEFGAQCTILALDAAREGDSWCVVTKSGSVRQPIDAVEWAARAVELGAGEILLTSFDRDGTGSGYDLELIASIRRRVRVPIIASGGAAEPVHLAEAVKAGADAVLAASIFHESRYTVSDVKASLANTGVEVRR